MGGYLIERKPASPVAAALLIIALAVASGLLVLVS